MIGVTLAAALLCAALWVAFPDPHSRLRLLEAHTGARMSRPVPLVAGRPGSPRLGTRVLAGVAVAVAVLAWQPTAVGAACGAVVGALVVGVGGCVVLHGGAPDATGVELADAVELLAVCLETGRAMEEAIVVVAQVSGTATASVLGRVTGQLGLGVPQQQAWRELDDHEVWGPVARDVARSAHSGTSLVEVLHVHADEARLAGQEVALQRARTAGVRSVVPLMTCFLPAFILVGVVPIIAGLLDGLLSP